MHTHAQIASPSSHLHTGALPPDVCLRVDDECYSRHSSSSLPPPPSPPPSPPLTNAQAPVRSYTSRPEPPGATSALLPLVHRKRRRRRRRASSEGPSQRYAAPRPSSPPASPPGAPQPFLCPFLFTNSKCKADRNAALCGKATFR